MFDVSVGICSCGRYRYVVECTCVSVTGGLCRVDDLGS